MSDLIRKLIEGTALSEATIRQVISSAPRRYKHYTIAKRSGGRRAIAHPAREVKALQRILLREFLSNLPVHPAAMAYEPGLSIRTNAAIHANNNGPILKMDLKDFFPSISVRDWMLYCAAHKLFDISDRIYAGRILFHKPKGRSDLRLAIGAPSSPHLSNLLMYEFDRRIAEAVAEDYVTYTRYADDLTFSAKRTGYLNKVQATVRRVIREMAYPKLTVNEAKTVLATPKYHRQVTGLVLTNDGRVSLGRERKRRISASLHHFKMGRLTPKQARELLGTMAFSRDVEPEFFLRMELKYGKETFELLKRSAATAG